MTTTRKVLFAAFALMTPWYAYHALADGQSAGIMLSACMLNMALLLNRANA